MSEQKRAGEISPVEKAIKDRIAFLIQAEKNAIIDIDGIPVGSHARQVSWNFIHELGHRKNELQDILKTIDATPEPVKDTPVEQKAFHCELSGTKECTFQCPGCKQAYPAIAPEQPAHVSDPNGNIREDIMDWIRQHPDANYVTMHGVYIGSGPDYWAGVMRMYRQQLPVIAKLTAERDAARQEGDVKDEKIQQAHADIRYWKEEYERYIKYTEQLMVLHKKVVAVFRDGLISAGLDFAAEPIQDYLDKI